MSATNNPEGDKGGPILVEPNIQPLLKLSWTIMPEVLSGAGVSWKVYQNKLLGPLNNTVVGYNGLVNDFKQSADPRSDLARFGIAPTAAAAGSPSLNRISVGIDMTP